MESLSLYIYITKNNSTCLYIIWRIMEHYVTLQKLLAMGQSWIRCNNGISSDKDAEMHDQQTWMMYSDIFSNNHIEY